MSDDIHKFPSDMADRFQVRMPSGLRDRIAAAAKVSGRSMNAEIVIRLQQSFELDTPALETATVDQLRQLRSIMAALLKTIDATREAADA